MRWGARRGFGRHTGVVFSAGALGLALIGVATPASAAGPVASPDTLSLLSGASATVSPLANDTDPENGKLTLGSVAVRSGSGTAVASGNTTVLITAAAGFVGSLVVDYTVRDGEGLTDASTITATVSAPPPPPNSPPVARADAASTPQGAQLRLDPRSNDSDPDGDALAITAATVKTPGAGSVSTDGRVLVIRPAAGFVGSMAITYVITDARGARATGTVTVTVVARPANRAPVAKADSVSVKAGRTYRIKVLANDSDPDRNRIRLVKVGKAKHGTAKRSGSVVVYRAKAGYRGSDRVTYKIKDSKGASARARLSIKVTAKKAPVKKPPVKKPPVSKPPPAHRAPTRRNIESTLAHLGFPVGYVNGSYDSATRRAVCAWRTVTGRRAHRGLPSASEGRAIVAMGGLPAARSYMVTGVNISVTCQAGFWVSRGHHYRRIMAATTGKPGYRTRLGTFRVFRTYHTWRYSTLYPEARMYKPMQFSGGQAMHGSATDWLVKTYPASHGCVRMFHRDIDALQAGGVGNGTLVRVFGHW